MILYLHTHKSLQNNIHVSKVHCRSAFKPGASGLPYYFTPPVCVPVVIGGLAVWRHNNNKKNSSCTLKCGFLGFITTNKQTECTSMSTGDWDLFLGPLEWVRVETGGAD